MLPTTLIFLASSLLIADGPSKPVAKVPANLIGEWFLTATKDARRADEASPSSTMLIHGDGKVIFKINELVTNRGMFKAGDDDDIRNIDLTLTDGRTLLGVYEVNRDVLVICFDDAGKGRPATVTPTGTQWAERWERTRP